MKCADCTKIPTNTYSTIVVWTAKYYKCPKCKNVEQLVKKVLIKN